MVSKRACHFMHKTYFGGGTVQMIDSRKDISVPRSEIHEQYEDGTCNYLGILGLSSGFDYLKKMTGKYV